MTAKSAAACHFDFCSTLHARSPRSGRGPQPRAVHRRLVAFTSGRTKNPHSSPTCLIQKRCPLRTSLLTRIRSEWLYRPLGRPPLTLTRLTPSVRYSRTCRRAAAQKNLTTTRTARRRLARSGPRARVTSSHCVASWLRPERDAGADLQNLNWKDRRAQPLLSVRSCSF